MRLFLDTSVLLAAIGSTKGASREIFRLARQNEWLLLTTSYVLDETNHNLPSLPLSTRGDWPALRQQLSIRDDVVTLPSDCRLSGCQRPADSLQRTRLGRCVVDSRHA